MNLVRLSSIYYVCQPEDTGISVLDTEMRRHYVLEVSNSGDPAYVRQNQALNSTMSNFKVHSHSTVSHH